MIIVKSHKRVSKNGVTVIKAHKRKSAYKYGEKHPYSKNTGAPSISYGAKKFLVGKNLDKKHKALVRGARMNAGR